MAPVGQLGIDERRLTGGSALLSCDVRRGGNRKCKHKNLSLSPPSWAGPWRLATPADAQETLTLQTITSIGTNTSPGTAQTLDLSDATNAPLFAAALTAFNAKNSDTIFQNSTSFDPGGQPVSPQFYPFGGPSVP